jgi:hypothetical protein
MLQIPLQNGGHFSCPPFPNNLDLQYQVSPRLRSFTAYCLTSEPVVVGSNPSRRTRNSN